MAHQMYCPLPREKSTLNYGQRDMPALQFPTLFWALPNPANPLYTAKLLSQTRIPTTRIGVASIHVKKGPSMDKCVTYSLVVALRSLPSLNKARRDPCRRKLQPVIVQALLLLPRTTPTMDGGVSLRLLLATGHVHFLPSVVSIAHALSLCAAAQALRPRLGHPTRSLAGVGQPRHPLGTTP